MNAKRKVWNKPKEYQIYCFEEDKKTRTFECRTWLDPKVAVACLRLYSSDIKYTVTNVDNRLGVEIGEYSQWRLFYNKRSKFIELRGPCDDEENSLWKYWPPEDIDTSNVSDEDLCPDLAQETEAV